MITDFYFAANITAYKMEYSETDTFEQFFQYIATSITNFGTTCVYKRFNNTTPLLLFPTVDDVINDDYAIVAWFGLGNVTLDSQLSVINSQNDLQITYTYVGIFQGPDATYGYYAYGIQPREVGWYNSATSITLFYNGEACKHTSYKGAHGIIYGDDFVFRLIKIGNSAYNLYVSPKNSSGSSSNISPPVTVGAIICKATSKIENNTIDCILSIPTRTINSASYISIYGKDMRFAYFYPSEKYEYITASNYFYVSKIVFDDYVVDDIYVLRGSWMKGYIYASVKGQSGSGGGVLDPNNNTFIDGLVIEGTHYVFPAIYTNDSSTNENNVFDILIKST